MKWYGEVDREVHPGGKDGLVANVVVDSADGEVGVNPSRVIWN